MGIDSMNKMIFLKQIKGEDGLLMVFGKPSMFLPARMVIEMQTELEKAFPKEKVGKIFHSIGKNRIVKGASFFSKFKGLSRAFERLSFGSPLVQMGSLSLSATGWGDFTIINSSPRRVLIKSSNSPFARAQLKEIGLAKKPVCFLLAGMLAGATNIALGGNYRAKEIQCAAMGKSKECIFEVVKISGKTP
jgi:hypothetical protein